MMLKVLGALAVVLSSFFITLQVLNYLDTQTLTVHAHSATYGEGAADGSKCPSDGVACAVPDENHYTAGVTQLYRELLGREPDEGGLKYWSGVAAQSGSLDPVREEFIKSEEYRAKTK
jgi:Domain of unknown function (DUF4214)